MKPGKEDQMKWIDDAFRKAVPDATPSEQKWACNRIKSVMDQRLERAVARAARGVMALRQPELLLVIDYSEGGDLEGVTGAFLECLSMHLAGNAPGWCEYPLTLRVPTDCDRSELPDRVRALVRQATEQAEAKQKEV
jgi:hypothetical protein